jgi:hypothetical protein
MSVIVTDTGFRADDWQRLPRAKPVDPPAA